LGQKYVQSARSHPKMSPNLHFWPYVNIQWFRAPFNVS